MELFNGVISLSGISFLLFCIFAIIAVGYALGRITIKGVALESAGVFVIALLFGCFLYPQLQNGVGTDSKTLDSLLSLIETLGLILFVTSVGFIAGPKFFGNLKKNFKSYVLLGLIIIVSGALVAVVCIFVGRGLGENPKTFTSTVVGLMSGSLTSTPAFSAAKEAAPFANAVSAGYAIAYIYGVIGVVLFVQIIPKLLKANMPDELAKITNVEGAKQKQLGDNLIKIDGYGLASFALATIIGVIIGKIKIPLTETSSFSLTTTGGCLLTALIFGHFGKVGKVRIMPEINALKIFRELGLILFLMGAGISGGAEFINYFDPVYLLYGFFMTTVPMIIGFLFAKYVLKLSLLNNLGSITGGMTSTPALGTLISVAKSEDVASAYAATYPIALIAVVLASQLILIFF
ncbi:MAG: permease [Ruminococcaceae bacterium]|nr:permease [Oscillospiraceae bacterium]